MRISLLENKFEKYWIWPGCSLYFGHIRTRTFFHSDSGAKKDLFTNTMKGWSETYQTKEIVSKIFILFLLWAQGQQLYELQLIWNCLRRSFRKLINFDLQTLVFPRFHFMTLHTHTFGFEVGPIQIRIAKAWIPIPARNFFSPEGFVWFGAILSHLIPSIWFKCFITNPRLFLRRRERKGEAKQHLSLEQENMLVWISCQILGRLVGSWWFGHISDFWVNFTELYCLPLDPHWRTTCQASLQNGTGLWSAALLGHLTSASSSLCRVFYSMCALGKGFRIISSILPSGVRGKGDQKSLMSLQSPCQAAPAFLLLLWSQWAFFLAGYFQVYRKFTRLVQSSCIPLRQPPPR